MPAQQRTGLFRVVGPVRDDVDVPPGGQAIGEEVDHLRAYEATFVVATLRPRIGVVDADVVQRPRRQHVAEQDDPVAPGHPDVGDACLRERAQEGALTWHVHVDGQQVHIWLRSCHGDGGLAHAEADLERHRRRPSEDVLQIERLPVHLEPESRTPPVVGLGLTGPDAPRPALVRPDVPRRSRVIGGVVGPGDARRHSSPFRTEPVPPEAEGRGFDVQRVRLPAW